MTIPIILTQAGNSGTLPGSIIRNIKIPALTTVVVDNYYAGQSCGIKWIYTICDSPPNQSIGGEIFATFIPTNNTSLNYNWSGITQSVLNVPHTISVSLNSGIITLSITNLHMLNTYIASILRLEILM